jgi:hypothetical protein
MTIQETRPIDLPWQLNLGLVLVDAKPGVFGLYRRGDDLSPGEVVAWVVALPDGNAVVLPDRGHPVFTSLAEVRRRWAPLMGAELVQVAGRDALHTAV